MQCRHLRLWLVAICRIAEVPLIANASLLEARCKSVGHKNCPLYAKGVAGTQLVKSLPKADCSGLQECRKDGKMHRMAPHRQARSRGMN